MTEISDRLRAHIGNDHLRGCEGRQYACDCGYDAETERLLGVAAIEIERLTEQVAASQASSGYAICVAQVEIERLRAALQTVRAENERAKRQFTNISNKILDDACRALEPKP